MKSRNKQQKSATCLTALSLFFPVLFLILGFHRPAQASPGDLDTSFGIGGIVTTGIGAIHDDVHALAIQSDGKLVAAGYSYNGTQYVFTLVRYNTDGSLDTTFGGGTGIVTPAIGTNDVATSFAIQLDGKLVAAGYSYNGTQYVFALVRYNTDGSLDTTFGTEGKVTTAIGTVIDKAVALTIQSDGKLVAAGYSNNGSQTVFALVRYNTNGSLDPTFGTGGIVTTTIGTNDVATSLAIQSDGKLVAAGYSNTGSQTVFALVRYNTDGSLDGTFGTGGIVTTAIGTNDVATSLAIQSDGKLVAAGYSYNSTPYVFTLVRYNTDGSLDTTFGAGGIVTTAIGTYDDKIFTLAIQSDGKLVAAGYSNNGTQYVFALVRYNTDGSLDTTFGTGGKVTTAIGAIQNNVSALAIQSDGKLVAAGYSYNGIQNEFALARYLEDPLGSTTTTTTTTIRTTTTTRPTITTTTSTTTTTVKTVPDLILTQVEPVGASVNAGGMLIINGTVKNQGMKTTTSFGVSYHLSLDSVYGGKDDINLTPNRKLFFVLPSGGTNTSTSSHTVPKNIKAGTYYVCASISSSAPKESNRSNNTLCSTGTVTVPPPDLVISELSTTTTTAKTGSTIHVSLSVTNQGGSRPDASSKVELHASINAIYGDGDDVASSNRPSISKLAPGQTKTFSNQSVKMPGTPGVYYICAKADADSIVTESDEANNTLCSTSQSR